MVVADDEVLHLTQQHILDELVVNDETDELQQLEYLEHLVVEVQLETELDEMVQLVEMDEIELQTLYLVPL